MYGDIYLVNFYSLAFICFAFFIVSLLILYSNCSILMYDVMLLAIQLFVCVQEASTKMAAAISQRPKVVKHYCGLDFFPGVNL